MTSHFRRARRLFLFMGAAAFSLVTHTAVAQTKYPEHNVRLVAPQGVGGGLDLVARLLSVELTKRLGESFYVDNQGGAGGVIGTSEVARAKPDGYTLEIAYVSTHGTLPAVMKVPYDPIKDFTPIAMIGAAPNVLAVSPALHIKTLKAFIAYAKANPGKLSYGTSGVGTLNDLAMAQFLHAAGITDLSVPYKSMDLAITDLIGGRVQSVFPGVAAALPSIHSGTLVPLAVTGDKRQPVIPNVPTFREEGFPQMQALTWYSLAGPAHMPPEVVAKLNATINSILADPAFLKRMAVLGLEPMPSTPEQLGAYMAKEIATWTQVAHDSHIAVKN